MAVKTLNLNQGTAREFPALGASLYHIVTGTNGLVDRMRRDKRQESQRMKKPLKVMGKLRKGANLSRNL